MPFFQMLCFVASCYNVDNFNVLFAILKFLFLDSYKNFDILFVRSNKKEPFTGLLRFFSPEVGSKKPTNFINKFMLHFAFIIVPLYILKFIFLDLHKNFDILFIKFNKKVSFTGFHTQVRFFNTEVGPRKPRNYSHNISDLLPPDFISEFYEKLPYDDPECSNSEEHQFVYPTKSKNANSAVNEYKKLLREGKKKNKPVQLVYGKDIVQWFSKFRIFLIDNKAFRHKGFTGDNFDNLIKLFSSNVEKSKKDPAILKELQNTLFRSASPLLSKDQVKTITSLFDYESYIFISEMKSQIKSDTNSIRFRHLLREFRSSVFYPHLESFLKSNEEERDARFEFRSDLAFNHNFSLLFAYIYICLVDQAKIKTKVLDSLSVKMETHFVLRALEEALYLYLYHVSISALKEEAPGVSDNFFTNFFLEANSLFGAFVFDGFGKGLDHKTGGRTTHYKLGYFAQFVILPILFKAEEGLLRISDTQYKKIIEKSTKYFYFKFKDLSFGFSNTFPLLIKPEKRTADGFLVKRRQGKNNSIIFNKSTVEYLNICNRTPYFIDKNTIKVVDHILNSGENLFSDFYKEVEVPDCDSMEREIKSMVEEVRICDRICSGFFLDLERSTKKVKIRKKINRSKRPKTLGSGTHVPTLVSTSGVPLFSFMLVETFSRLKSCNEGLERLLERRDKMNYLFIQLQYAKVLQGYELYFLNRPDFRLRLWSFMRGNLLFSRNRGFSKYFVCGPSLELTRGGLYSLFEAYCTFNKKAVLFYDLLKGSADAIQMYGTKKNDMFERLKLTSQEKGKDYLFLSLLELTIEECLLTRHTGFLMPVDQKSSVWVFTGLFFRNKKIMELTRILSNPSELSLISYLQSKSEDLLLMVLKTKGPVTQEFYKNIIFLVDLFSNDKAYHKTISMILLLGAGKFSVEDALNELLVKIPGLKISDSLKLAITFFLGSYSDFLDQKLDGIMTQVKLFKTFSMKYFKLKFDYIANEIKEKRVLIEKHQTFLKNSEKNSQSSLQIEIFIESLKKEVVALEKKSCLSFRILSGEIGFSQDVVESKIRKQVTLPLYTENRRVKTKQFQVRYLERRGNLPATRRQLMSSMIHSMESTILRDILLSLNEEGITINHCHDCFQVHPNHYETFISAVHKTYFKRFNSSSVFWNLSNTLVNVDGIFWLDDPILTDDQRLDLKKKFNKFISTFHFEKMPSNWIWSKSDAVASYPFENK